MRDLQTFVSSGGIRIYRIPLQLFPELWGYAHLVVAGELRVLVDVGSGFGDSNQHLEQGLQRVRAEHGEPIEWTDLTHVLVTHGHIDHFGGLHYVRERTAAAIGVHELDLRVLSGYEERVATMAGRLGQYLIETGIEAEERQELLDLYLLGKQLFRSIPVDFTYGSAGMQIGSLELTHVPGHAPGQVTIRCDNILLSADHVLPETSPHLAPERLSLNTGMGHYLESVRQTWRGADRIQLVLGGHEQPFTNLAERIEQIWSLYQTRLGTVLELLEQPRTIRELAQRLFGETAGYHRLLALEEAGAYVEYLQQRGYLAIEDLEQLERGTAFPGRYRRALEGDLALPHMLVPAEHPNQLSR